VPGRGLRNPRRTWEPAFFRWHKVARDLHVVPDDATPSVVAKRPGPVPTFQTL
jgi:hypothetical protein